MQASQPDSYRIPSGAEQPPLQAVAEYICEICATELPDLSTVTILLPQLRIAALLREALLAAAERRGHRALLLPTLIDLRGFAEAAATDMDRRPIQSHERLLLLVDAMRKHRYLYGQGSPWLLAENLLQLFDELTLHNVNLPPSLQAFIDSLSRAYRLPGEHELLQREAKLVLTLWQAWHTQLDAEQLIDGNALYLQQLNDSLKPVHAQQLFFATGFTQLLPAERQWLQALAQKARLHWIMCDDAVDYLPKPGLLMSGAGCDYDRFLNACYDHDNAELRTRIQQCRQQLPHSPLRERLHILGVNQLEQHAQAIALFTRATLADGARHVGIVCEDLRLARRTRALLERSRIYLHDTVGWALSTTRAAAILESWLECIEQDFPHRAFLDLLKSPALIADADDEMLHRIYRFEHDIVLHENIGSGLERYRKALYYRRTRLQHWSPQSYQAIDELLLSTQQTAAALQARLTKPQQAVELLQLLIDSLQTIDRQHYFQNDDAGQAVTDLLQRLLSAARQRPLPLEWPEFRGWLKRVLEQEYFLPPTTSGHSVLLLNLAQSQLMHFDALVIAAADEAHFPGDNGRLPFFNDSVRTALGLPDWRQRLRQREYLFRRLLSSSPSVLITWQCENNGEPVAASPWVRAIEQFHQQTYGESLQPAALAQWLQQDLFPAQTDARAPASIPVQPAPAIAAQQLPDKLSVSAHQRLIDCPYRFYVYDVLHLKPLDEIREALQKSDYGNRVHRCLEAFHIGIDGLPGPFGEKLDSGNRHSAIALMQEIAQRIFKQDIEDNFQHRGWLQRWLSFIPKYLDWQSQHEQQWRIHSGELKTETPLDEQTVLYGRIDRVEYGDSGINLVDYKTGQPKSVSEIVNGEDVQLTSYSLLLDHVDSVQYVGLDDRKGVNDRSRLQGEEFKQLQTAVRQRLINLLQRIRNGAPLPAIGDEDTCRYCDAKGICRRAYWK